MSHFKDNSWVQSSRSKSVLMSLRCSSIRSRSKSHDDVNCSQGGGNTLNIKGQNGFEELRRYIKQGGDFGKDLVNILQERIDAEQIYSKSLSKMANKLNKACRDVPGTIVDAWRGVATEMESRSEVHRQLSVSLNEEICKPLKSLLEAHHKTRKTVETNVDKASRILNEWRISEAKAKKISHTAARENEKLQDAMLDVRIQKSPSIALLHQQNSKDKNVSEKEIKSAEKDCAKLDNKRRKAEEAVKRADVEYYTLCIRAERARVDWEMSVLRGSTVLQNLEMQRLSSMKQFITNYSKLTSDINPILEQLCQRISPQIEACNVQKDLVVIKNIRRAAEGPSEQLLPDFYCEHTTLAMNRERRKHSLIKLLQLVKTDLDRERRSRNGLKGLSQTMINQDNQNITDKLYHIRSMLTYLEGSRFKLQSALLELDHKPRSTHPLAPHIQITRDRTGLQQSILKVPLWLKNDDKISSSNNEDETNNILNDSNGSRDDSIETSSNHHHNHHLNTNNHEITNCIDIKNDMLVKNFNRSKSTTDILLNGTNHHLNDTINIKNNTININHHDTSYNNHHHHHDLDSPNFDRGIADGGSNQPDSDFDEFSSQDDDDEQRRSTDKLNGIDIIGNDYDHITNLNKNSNNSNNNINNNSNKTTKTIVLSRCKALYSYTPKLYDELELTPGDIIEVHVKQDDGWWLGALGDQIGIFPATYVEEFV
ncbi:uncharacterized protein LOC129607619 isoform X2 [Condylostylus longicornis]|uniref:uncharacterized protein LOC129607619 isoform X2 n=1 Tax=Condylostylus longicornis TaxID=2530218 RepID=UPI00244DEED0|nr:uncharacterized protein LOC129607619 isoform X2 [Condylostylus longicornis]